MRVDSDEDDEESSSDKDEDEPVVPGMGDRLRPNPRIPQRLGKAHSHASQIIHCSIFDCSLSPLDLLVFYLFV